MFYLHKVKDSEGKTVAYINLATVTKVNKEGEDGYFIYFSDGKHNTITDDQAEEIIEALEKYHFLCLLII